MSQTFTLRDVFGPADWTPGQKAMMAELMAQTRAHGEDDAKRLWAERVIVHVVLPNATTAYLYYLEALTPGRGDGDAALRWLCGLSDRHGVALALAVLPKDARDARNANPLKDPAQLAAYYARRGFVPVREHAMRREPGAPQPVSATRTVPAPRGPA